MLITNLNQIKRQHGEQLALKMRLEDTVAFDVRKLTRSILMDFKSYYISHPGAILSTDNYSEDLIGILRHHYRKVASHFSHNIRGEQKAIKYDRATVDKNIDLRLADYIMTKTRKQSGRILTTLKERLHSAIKEVTIEGATQGIQLYPPEIADKVTKQLNAEMLDHSFTIGATETQDIAEQSKITEAQALSEFGIANSKKYWDSNLDEKTRSAHIFANGQTVSLDEVFIVGGEELNRPGDEELGASAWNIIGCRCNCLYLSEEIGKAATIAFENKCNFGLKRFNCLNSARNDIFKVFDRLQQGSNKLFKENLNALSS